MTGGGRMNLNFDDIDEEFEEEIEEYQNEND